MANPLVIHQQEANHASSSFNAAYLNNVNPIPETSSSGMMHNPGLCLDWTVEEQAILVNGLKKYSSEPGITCYVQIALNLPNKTVRDVAMRCRWMTTKETNKRRKVEHNLARKSKDKGESLALPSAQPTHFAAQPNLSINTVPMITRDYDGDYRAFGWATAQLLQQNKQVLEQINANLSVLQIQENIILLYQIRENILKIMNNIKIMPVPDIWEQMPGIEVKMNDELASAILPLSLHPPMCNPDPASNTILPPSLHPPMCNPNPASNTVLPLSLHPPICNPDPASNTVLPLSLHPPMCNPDPASNTILPLSLHPPTMCNPDPASNTILPLSLHPMQCNQGPAFNPSSVLASFP